ncbi:hypothetical protein ScPMuIL_011019 [Solemya velum]
MLYECYKKVNDKIGDGFSWYGKKVSRHPWKFITVSALCNCLLSLGFLGLNVVNDAETLYTPENSQAFQDRNKVRDLFPSNSSGDFYLHNLADFGQYAHVIMQPKSGEVLETEFLQEAKSIYQYIKNTVVQTNGVDVSYEDICAKRNSACIVNGDEFLEPTVQSLLLSKRIPYPEYLMTYMPNIFGNGKEENGFLVSAGAYKLRFNIRDDGTDVVDRWRNEFAERINKLKTNVSITYEHTSSLNDELNANLGADITLFTITFTLMCTYASLATINANCLTDRSLLGLGGVLATALAILGAFGLCTACGVPFISIVGVTPFLVVGIGVDDMFILLSVVSGIRYVKIESRVARMMRTSGMGITITSLTDLFGLLIGSASSFPAIQYFCIYTGVAILFCYTNHVTFFTACISIDQNRVEGFRHSKTCMRMKSKEKLEEANAGKGMIWCCSGDIPQTRKDVESPVERYVQKFFAWLSGSKTVKPFTILLLLLYWGISVWGAVFFKEGLFLENLVDSDSYFYKYSVTNRKYYKSEVVIMLIIDEKLDYTSVDVRQNVQKLLTDVKSDKHIDTGFQLSWLEAYSNSPQFNDVTTEDFVQNLKLFLDDTRGKIFADDVVFAAAPSVGITACRVYVRSLPSGDSDFQSGIMTETREIAKKHEISATAYAPSFIFFEQYANILTQTIQTLLVVAACILVVTFIFMPHPFIIVLVTVAVTSMMTGLIGFMYFWDLTLSSITMIHIIMSVGFSVDYSAHICHAFMIANGQRRDVKMRQAMEHVGGPVFSGAFTSFLGIIVLVFSTSYIFESFFKVMLIVIIIGTLHALLFLPTILSLIGPLAPTKTFTTNQREPSQITAGD